MRIINENYSAPVLPILFHLISFSLEDKSQNQHLSFIYLASYSELHVFINYS